MEVKNLIRCMDYIKACIRHRYYTDLDEFSKVISEIYKINIKDARKLILYVNEEEI